MTCDICKKKWALYIHRAPFIICKPCYDKIQEKGDWRDNEV